LLVACIRHMAEMLMTFGLWCSAGRPSPGEGEDEPAHSVATRRLSLTFVLGVDLADSGQVLARQLLSCR
jgi:hypothetical protein